MVHFIVFKIYLNILDLKITKYSMFLITSEQRGKIISIIHKTLDDMMISISPT